jgi:chlorobactene glucosyltransferase
MIFLVALIGVCVIVLWNVLRWPAARPRTGNGTDRVSVLIPARDEELNIEGCIDSVVLQEDVAEILVYDDHSTDATRHLVESHGRRDPRIRLAEAEPLPPRWCGKTFACAQLAEQAVSDWFLFLDADARLTPGAVAGMLTECRNRGATFLSCWPGLELRSFWEKLLMPVLNFVVFTIYPAPLAFSRNDPSLGLAHGACILVERHAYESVGGHAAVAQEIFEDTLLARAWRERGERSLCVDGRHVVRVRMYAGPGEIWMGFQKNFRSAFRSETAFWAFVAMHVVLFLLPFVLANPAALLVIAARLMLACRFRHPAWSALLHPLAECFLLALAISSWRAWRNGRGVVWKGRLHQHP